MVTSVFFDNFTNQNEQNLYEDIIIEAIRIYGMDCYYLPKTLVSYDKIYGEDDNTEYNKAYMIEMYIKSVDGFEGDGVFFSKFDLQIRNRVTFAIAKRVFDDEIGGPESLLRPNEGDLIYFPLNKKCFQILYTNDKPVFYPMGQLPTYELSTELFEYSNEKFNTGIPEIDEIQTILSNNILDRTINTEDGFPIATEDDDLVVNEDYNFDEVDTAADNEEIQIESDDLIDFSETSPFAKNGRF